MLTGIVQWINIHSYTIEIDLLHGVFDEDNRSAIAVGIEGIDSGDHGTKRQVAGHGDNMGVPCSVLPNNARAAMIL